MTGGQSGSPRLTPLDAAFLYFERPTQLLHVELGALGHAELISELGQVGEGGIFVLMHNVYGVELGRLQCRVD